MMLYWWPSAGGRRQCAMASWPASREERSTRQAGPPGGEAGRPVGKITAPAA
jgi:hypothetical protein